MRKVYHSQSSVTTLPMAIMAASALTALLFCVIPFSHMVNKPGSRTLELRRTSAVDLPPPVDEPSAPPPPEIQKPREAPVAPQLADTPRQVPLSADLEVAMGSGGALAGFGEVRALTAVQAIQDETFDVSELEKRPEAVSQSPPIYPPDLRKAKIEGAVTLVFVLNEEGRVEEPRVENSTRPEFEKPALDAIRKWRFRPGLKDGRAVRSYIRIPMRFRISSG